MFGCQKSYSNRSTVHAVCETLESLYRDEPRIHNRGPPRGPIFPVLLGRLS